MSLQNKERLNVVLTMEEQRKFVELGLLLNTIRVKAGLSHVIRCAQQHSLTHDERNDAFTPERKPKGLAKCGMPYTSQRANQQKEKGKKISLSKKQALLFINYWNELLNKINYALPYQRKILDTSFLCERSFLGSGCTF